MTTAESRVDDVRTPHEGQRGFSLIEALIAVIVLAFGLVAVMQLMTTAAASNTNANRSTAAAAEAGAQLERLMSVPYNNLVQGGTLDVDNGCGGNLMQRQVEGVGLIQTCWSIQPTGNANLLIISVRSEAQGLFSRLTRAEFTTFRTLNVAPPVGTPAAAP